MPIRLQTIPSSQTMLCLHLRPHPRSGPQSPQVIRSWWLFGTSSCLGHHHAAPGFSSTMCLTSVSTEPQFFSPWRTHEHFQLNYTNDLRILCLIPWFHWLLDLTIWSCYKDFKLYKSKIKPTILHLRWLAFRGSTLCPQRCVLLVDLPGRCSVQPKASQGQAWPHARVPVLTLGTVLRGGSPASDPRPWQAPQFRCVTGTNKWAEKSKQKSRETPLWTPAGKTNPADCCWLTGPDAGLGPQEAAAVSREESKGFKA